MIGIYWYIIIKGIYFFRVKSSCQIARYAIVNRLTSSLFHSHCGSVLFGWSLPLASRIFSLSTAALIFHTCQPRLALYLSIGGISQFALGITLIFN